MSKPIIGVTPLYDAIRRSVWILPEYQDGIQVAGGPRSCDSCIGMS